MNELRVFCSLVLFMIIKPIFPAEHYHSPRRIEANYTFEMMIDAEYREIDRSAGYWLLLPANSSSQRNIQFISIHPKPDKLIPNFAGESQLAYWRVPSRNAGGSFRITIDLIADLYQVDYFLDPNQVPDDYGQLSENLLQFVNSDSLAYVTPQVSQLALNLTRHATDPLVKVRNIYRWAIDHLEPQFPVTQRGTRALFVNDENLLEGNYSGDSAEYAWAFVALCRAVGIPARSVTGFLAKPNTELPHNWAEFYLPSWGWLPADPYLADSEELLREFSGQADAFYYFGHLDHYHLAFYKGNGFMIEPKSNLTAPPFIFQGQVWFAPIGIWDFGHFTNAGANLMVHWEGLLIYEFELPEYGLVIHFPTTWQHQHDPTPSPYLLKEKFITTDKSTTLDLMARELPSENKDIDAATAAKLELTMLKQSFPELQLLSEQEITVDGANSYQFISKFKSGSVSKWEYRLYIVQPNHLFWLIGSSSENDMKKVNKIFEPIIKGIRFRWPEGFR
ncbi:MAG: transglutaminase-like domain-containing protein [candidate division KSB1 bacterium]|nr:transglutaminase-like domain-containing protein [candidate division KSB1 bacterium]